ncbi:MAG: hypothetical protein LBG05_00725 [Treponema sp.]|nr:hypothetical protein [Treponema sp.]
MTHYVNGGFTLKFDAFDSNALKDVSITRKSGGTSDNIVPTLVKNGTNQWNVTLTEKVGTGDGELGGGSYEYTLLVRDAADKTTTQTFTVAVDTTAPVVDLKFPVENVGDAMSVVMNAELSINGTAADGPTGSASGVEQVFYQITDSAAAPPLPTDYNALGGWKLSNGMSQWSATELLSSTQQGSQYLHVFARDVVHNAGAIKSTRFEVDTENPEIGDAVWGNTIQVGATRYVNGGFTLKFSVFDSNALHNGAPISLTRKIVGGTSVDVKPSIEKTGYYKGDFSDQKYGSYGNFNEKNLWGVTLTEKVGTGDGELGSGSYEYTLLVKDVANKTATQTFTIAVDITPPEIEVTGVTPTVAEAGGTYTVNGIARVNFNASDNEGIGEENYGNSSKRQIKYLLSTEKNLTDAETIYKESDAVLVDNFPNYDDGKSGSVMVKQSESKSLYINTQKLTDKAEAYLYIAVQDRAGNFGYSKTTLYVDQSTDKPSIVFTDIDTTIKTVSDLLGKGSANVLGSDAKIRGTFTDDDAIDVTTTKPKLVIWKENEENDKKSLDLTGLTGTGTVSFSLNRQTLGGAFNAVDLAEGVYFFTLEVSDATSGDFAVTSVQTTIGEICFAVDTDNPKITVTTPTRGSYQSETFTLSGTIADNSNKATGLPPVLTIKDPDDASASSFTFTYYDAATGEWAWTYAVTGISDMEKTVRIVAKDRFGKETTDDFTVEFDKTAPIVTIKQPVINKWFEGVTMAFNGSLSDDSGKGLQKVYYFIMKPGVMAVPTAPASPLDTTKVDVQWQEANITGNTWSIMADLSDDAVAVEGTNVLYVIGYDAAGNGPDKDTANWNSGAPVWSNSWASNVPSKNTAASTLTFMVDRAAPVADLKFYKASDSTYTTALADKDYIDEGFSLYGTVTDSNELATLVVKQNDAEVPLTASELTQTNSKSWSVNLAGLPRAPNNLSTTLANPEGVYVYTIEVADKSVGLLHNVTLKQTLTVDTSGPAVTIMSPAEGEPFNSASITVTGAADDGTAGAGVSKVYFRIGGPATNYTVPNGTEVDGDPNNIKNWVLANGTTQWSKTGVAIGSIEGSLKFTAFAEDDLGNKGAASVHNFYVDASNPEILDDDYVAISAEKYTNGAFTLKFTAFDSNILNTEATDAGGKLAGVVITRTSGGTPTEVFNAYTVSDGFKSISENAYTDSYGNKLTIKGTYTGVLDGRLSIKDYSLEKVWGVTLNQNDLASGLLADGIYDYTITVTDAGGRTASKTVTITVDAAAPSLDVTRFTALVNRDVGGGDGLLDYVNGVIQFAVSASDENGLAVANPLQYWILPASAATPAPTATNWTSAGGTFFGRSDQPLINTESGSDNQSTPATFDQTGTKAASTYKLHIGAMDKAGNIGLTTYNTDAHADYSFVINQETDKPFVSITSPGADAYVGSSHLVQGVLTDDDGFKASASDNDRIEIHYTTDGGSNWQPVKGTITTTKITDFEYNFTYSVADIGNTPIWVQVTAKDDASKKLVIGGSNAPQVTAVETVNFTIDSTPPALSVATAEDTFNKNFSLTGSFVERNYRTGTLQVGINGGGKTALTPTQDVNFATNSTWNWTYNVDLNALQDGVNTIEFEVYDAREQVGRKSVVVNKDTTAPTVTVSEFKNFVTVTNAGNTVNYVNGVVKFAVLASDNIGTKETRYWLLPKTSDASAESARVIGLGSAMGALGYDTSKAVDAATNNPANGTVFTGTEVTLDTASDVDNQQSPVAIVDKTEYTLYVGVSDKAGNAFVYTYLPNAAVNYSFHVDQSTDAPVLTFDNLSVGEENFIAGGVLSGSITDDDGFAQAESLVIAFAPDNNGTPDDWSILTGFTPARTMIGTREIKWSTALPTDIATDGAYHIRVNVTDDGTKKVGAEGDKLFTGTPVQFTLDTTPPIPAITTLGVADGTLAASVSSAPAIKGTLVETNPLSLTVTVKDGVGATVAEGLFNQGMLSTSDWAWNWAPSTGAGAFVDLPDGPYTVVVETIDRVNTQAHSGSVQSVFNKDTAAPSIAFSNLSKEMILTRELMLEVADESDGYTGWTGHGLSGSPTNAEIHTKALTVYKETKAAMTDIIRNTDTNLRGTFTDEYSGVTKFDYRFDTDPYDDTAIDDANKTMWRSGSGKLGTPNAKTSSWIIPIPAANETAGSAPYTDSSTYPVKDGIRRVTIRVYDALGNAGAKTDIAFYLDREAPVFDLTQFGGGASGNDAASLIYSVGGLANDMDVVFTLKGGVRDANIKTLSVSGVGGVTPVLSGETESGKEFTYTVTKSAFTALAEGLHTITLNAVDIADNNAQTTWTFVKDTTPPENTFLNMSGLASNTASNPFLFGDGSAKVMGSTLDATSGLKSLTYTLQAKNGVDWSNPVDKSVDQPLTATPTWNIVLGGGGLSLNDGQYRIKVMAEDNAKRTGGTDNPNTTVNGTGLSEWIYFVLDTINPILSVESTKQYYNGDIPLKGNATDDNGIASVEVSFSSFPTESKKSLTTDASGNWAVIMPIADSAYTLTQGKQTINITAYDNAGHATTVQKEFTLDTTPPDGVVVKQPNASGARVTGKLTVSGVANDNNSVSKIFYQIGKPDLTETSTIAAGKAYTIQTLGTVSEWTAVGAPLNAQVGTAFIADKGGTVSGTARAWKDTLLDSATAATDTTPTTITWSGGVWAWNVAFAELKYFVNASGAAAYDGTGGTYGVQRYRYTSATDDQLITYANDNSNLTQTAPENNVWDVPINVLVFDSAGNATACDFYITVDPHMDKATSEILTPDGKQAVGGTVRLTGTASDNNIVNSVWVRVSGAAHTDTEVWVDPHDHTKGYTNWSFSEWTESGANGSADKWYDWDTNWSSSVAANTTYAGSDSSLGVGWHAASLQGPGSGMVNWYINLNANGKLNPPSGTNERTVYIEVFARDTKNDNDYTSLVNSVNGYITRSILTFSSNVPIIENITVTPQGGSAENYTYQMQISQTVTIEADVKDSDGISAITVQATGGTPIPVKDKTDETIGNLKVTAKVADDKTITSGETIKAGMRYYVADETSFSYAGWSTGTKIFTAGSTDSASPGGVLYEEDVNGFFVYHVEMTIDSASLFPEGTGTYGLALSTTDDSASSLSASQAMSFQIDNYFPRAVYTASTTAVGDYTLRGTVNDAPTSGSIQGLKSVTVYFSRDAVYYMPSATKSSGMMVHMVSTDSSAQTTVKARKWDGTNLAVPADVVYPKSGYGIVIDVDESASGEKDGDNFVEYWYDNAGSEKTWGATFDSTVITDGKITVHYLAEDRAGNKTYAEQEVYFQNHAPSITSLTLGTPLIGSTITAEGQKSINDRYLDNVFTVRNSLFQIKLNVSGGNGDKHYRMSYLTRSAGPISSIMKDKIYTVASTNAGFDFKTIGAEDSIVGAPFVATRNETTLNGATVFEYTPTALVKTDAGGIGNGAAVSAAVDFTSSAFGSGADLIADSADYAVVRVGGTLTAGQKYRIEELGDTAWSSLVGIANAEKGSTFIPLTNTTMTGSGAAVTSNDRYFFVKVWDSTMAGAGETEQLSDFVLLAVRVENEDKRPPVTQLYDLNPKAETTLAASVSPVVMVGSATTVQNTTKGSLYLAGGKISGHIEPRDGKGDGTTIDTAKANIWLEHELDENGDEKNPIVIKPSGFVKDTASGIVVLRGQAQDDQRITALYLDFEGAKRKILEADTDGRLKRSGALTTDDVGVYQTLGLDGHYVEWTYRWNTELMSGDITVTARAEDKSAGAANQGAAGGGGVSPDRGNAADNTEYNSIGLSLAPYITTLTRFKNSAGMTEADKAPALRSRNGWFSFRRGVGDVERMQIEGFNLAGSVTSVKIDGVDGGTLMQNLLQNGTYYIDVPSAVTSGYVTYTADGVEAVNNRNNNANSWNTSQEALVGNESSALWNDDRAVHLFDSHNIEAGANQGHFRNPTVVGSIVKPAMTIDPSTGRLWASWSSYMINNTAVNHANGGGAGSTRMPMYFSHNSDGDNGATLPNNARPVSWSMDPSEDTDISWNTTDNRRSIVYLANYMTSGYGDGGLCFWDTGDGVQDMKTGTPVERFDNAGNSQLLQFINPRIVNDGNVSHIAYYDDKYHVLRYWNTNKSGALRGWEAPGVVVDGVRPASLLQTFENNDEFSEWRGTNYQNKPATATFYKYGDDNSYVTKGVKTPTDTRTRIGGLYNNSSYIAYMFAKADGILTSLSNGVTVSLTDPVTAITPPPDPTAPDAGNYSAIDVNSAGIPVIAYLVQDKAAGTEKLKYAYGNAADATTFTTADIATIGISTAGRYVSMRIDKDTAAGRLNVMHIVFMDSDNGDLVYIKGTPSGTSGAYTFGAPVVIDSVGNVGKWADIAIDATGNPVVSYLDQGGIDSRTGFKMAFLDSAVFGGNGWEYVTLPGRYVVNDVRTQVECDSRIARVWDAAFAYVSDDYYRISYYVK